MTARTVNAGYELNVPLSPVFCREAAENGTLPASRSYFTCDSDSVILDTVKAAENGNGIIVRLYESGGTKTDVFLSTILPCSHVVECNLVETDENEVPTENGAFRFTIKPFEIKTFRLS